MTAMNKGLFGKLTFWKVLLGMIVAAGLYATVVRYARGLGAATNLSDAFPWGLWIGFDMLVGVGLAAGGFVVAATVHVFKLEKYEEIARPTILTAFLGYLLVIVALLFDLGRPWNIWHPIIMWNPHSVMFEVGWCVMLYTTVLALEFSPLLFERFGLHFPLRVVRRIYVPLVILGVLLSTMHQSSLGTLYVIVPDKLHDLWYTPMLPVFFFLTAVAAGLCMTIFESFMSFRAFGKRLEAELLQGLGRVAVVVLAVYAVWKTEDLAARGAIARVFEMSPESVLFWGEAGLGVLLPMVLFAIPRVRRSETGLFLAATLTIMGFIVNRMNVAITGMAASSGVWYFPSLLEIVVTMTLVAAGFTAFGLAVKFLPIFPDAPRAALVPRPVVGAGTLAGLWGLLLAGAGAVGWSLKDHGVGARQFLFALVLMLLIFLASTILFRYRFRLDATGAGTQARGSLALPAVAASLVVGVFAVGFSLARNPAVPRAVPRLSAEDIRMLPARPTLHDLRLPADYVFPRGKDSPGTVTFSHQNHVDTREFGCASCHARLFRITEAGKPVSDELTQSRIHEGELCASCHDGKTAFAVQDNCTSCHQ